jgi:hypothetical protein
MARLFPRSLREVVGKAARPLLKKRGFAESSLLMDWPHIVGSTLAQHTVPISIRFARGESTGGTLAIACNPAFALELQQLSPILLEKLATHIGYRAITRITIEQRYVTPLASTLPPNASAPTAEEPLSDDPLTNALARLEKIRAEKSDKHSKPQ